MKLRDFGLLAAGIVAGGGVIAALRWDKTGNRNNHDEPIIVDNGPLSIDFTTRGIQPDDEHWLKASDLPKVIRFWKDSTLLDPCRGQCTLDATKDVMIYVAGADNPIQFKPSNEHKKVYIMNGQGTKFDEPPSQTPTKIHAQNKNLRITSVMFTELGKRDPTTVTLRGSPPYRDTVKIALCVDTKDEEHCPTK